jgi:tetratricopeptide (TPR) repeat protein
MSSRKRAPPPSADPAAAPKRGPRRSPPEAETSPGGVSIDRSEVHVGGDLAGGNIVKVLVNLPAPALYAALGLGLLLLVASVGPALVAHFRGPSPMGAFFNIAVAEFGQVDERGQAQPSEVGAALSQSIFDRISDELEPFRRRNFVEIRGSSEVGRIGGSESDWDRAAQQLTDKHRAHLLIYGNFENRAGQPRFLPRFYVSPTQQELRRAQELTGPNGLGAPLAGTRFGPSDSLDARTRALILFTIGLVYLADHDTDQAVRSFSEASEVTPWTDVDRDGDGKADSDGKEVIALFLGTAHALRNREGDVQEARNAYQIAVNLNRNYGRAYIGLGNVAYREFQQSDQTDEAKLDEAEIQYRRAIEATDKPESAHVDDKAHLALGNLYLVKAQGNQPGLFDTATEEYHRVLTEYEGRGEDLQPLAAAAYYGLGLVQELGSLNDALAADYYRQSVSRSADDPELRRTAESRLERLESSGRLDGRQ